MKLVLSFALLVTACGSNGGGRFGGPPTGGDDMPGQIVSDMADQVPSDMAGQVPSDLAKDEINPPPDGAMALSKPVGAGCSLSSECTGPNPKCYTTIPKYNWSTPGGYCSNSGCGNDLDCGSGGICDTASGNCFANCLGKGQCEKLKANLRCFYFDNIHNACLPDSLSSCDPTSANSSCPCKRKGWDNVGACMIGCTVNGGQCTSSQQCLFYNAQYDLNGKSTGDFFLGWSVSTKE